jgi:hypothetical protein
MRIRSARRFQVSLVNRFIAALLMSFSIGQGAYCDPSSTDKVSNEVIELRETVVALTGDPDINSTLDMLAAVQVRVVGAANDSTWKGDNPNWTPVFNVVHDDLSRDVGLLLLAQVRDMAAHWDHELPARLTPSQIDELLKFYRSDVGRRYLAFQKQLIAVQEKVLSASVVGRASARAELNRVTVAPTVAQIDSRKSVAALSWVYLTVLGPSSRPSLNASAADDKTINDMMVDALAKMRGPELDLLNAQYHADLPAFATFQGSPVAKALISVFGLVAKGVQADLAAPGIVFAAALQRSIEQHTPEWKAAYEAARASAH